MSSTPGTNAAAPVVKSYAQTVPLGVLMALREPAGALVKRLVPGAAAGPLPTRDAGGPDRACAAASFELATVLEALRLVVFRCASASGITHTASSRMT